jgi:hypothetical protein
MHFEAKEEKKKQVQSEMKQLQEEKEKIYTENRETYKLLQREREQEVGMLKEQNQRLQIQLNNTQE